MAGGVSGALGKVAGVLAKTTTKLTFDEQYQEERRRSSGSKGIGQGLEGAAKVVPCTSNKHSPCQLLSVDTCMAVILEYRITPLSMVVIPMVQLLIGLLYYITAICVNNEIGACGFRVGNYGLDIIVVN